MTSEVVRVTEKGQATIPVGFRERFGISAPGLVRFRDDKGRLVVEPLPTPDEMMGSLKKAFGKDSVTELVLREREKDKEGERRKLR